MKTTHNSSHRSLRFRPFTCPGVRSWILTCYAFLSCSQLVACSLLPSSSPAPEMPIIVAPIDDLQEVRPASVAPSSRKTTQEALAQDGLELATPEHSASIAETSESEQMKESVNPEDSPISLRVAQKFYDGDDLVLRVHLGTKTAVAADEIAVEAVGLSNGEVKTRDIRFLDSIVSSEIIEKDQTLSVSLRLADADITEYQIRGMWGLDARSKRPKQIPAPEQIPSTASITTENSQRADPSETSSAKALDNAAINPQRSIDTARSESGVALHILKVDRKKTDCGTVACPEVVTLYGVLENNSAEVVSDIRLAVGLFWKEGSQALQLPKPGSALTGNEREVRLPTAMLLPGERKRIRLFVDRELPVIPGGEFVPKARVLTAGSMQNRK